MSNNAAAATIAPARSSPIKWFLAAGVALGLLLTFLGRPGAGAIDPSTVVSVSQWPEMDRQYAHATFSLLAGFDYGERRGPGGVALDETGREKIPAAVQRLSGTKVGVTGFMLPLDYDNNGVTKFILNANYDMCYYGAPTRPNDFVVVTMRGGRRTQFVHTPVVVYGTLRIEEERRGDRVVSLYQMDGDAIAIGVQPRP